MLDQKNKKKCLPNISEPVMNNKMILTTFLGGIVAIHWQDFGWVLDVMIIVVYQRGRFKLNSDQSEKTTRHF